MHYARSLCDVDSSTTLAATTRYAIAKQARGSRQTEWGVAGAARGVVPLEQQSRPGSRYYSPSRRLPGHRHEDGIKLWVINILYSLQHVGHAIPPSSDAGWIGEAGPGPWYLDLGSRGSDNDFTNRNPTFVTGT